MSHQFDGCCCPPHDGGHDQRPVIRLDTPDHLSRYRADPSRGVVVDACIAHIVEAVWEAGHVTLGSCCGHGRSRPELVIEESERDYASIRAAIAAVDDRDIGLMQWQLVDVRARAAGWTADED